MLTKTSSSSTYFFSEDRISARIWLRFDGTDIFKVRWRGLGLGGWKNDQRIARKVLRRRTVGNYCKDNLLPFNFLLSIELN